MPTDQKLLQGQFPEIERCVCGLPMLVDFATAQAMPLAYRRRDAGLQAIFSHVVSSLPCNQRQEINRAAALGLVQAPYTRGWHEAMREAHSCDKRIEFVCVVDPTARRGGEAPYSLFVPQNAALLMSATPSPSISEDDTDVFEHAAKVIAVCTGADMGAAVVTLKASLTMQMWERDEPHASVHLEYKGVAQFAPPPGRDQPSDHVDSLTYMWSR